MAKHGKTYRKVLEKLPAEAVELQEGISFIRENRRGKFDETMELGIRLGVDPKKSEHAVRGTVNLPHGTGKTVRVVVFASGPAAEAVGTVT